MARLRDAMRTSVLIDGRNIYDPDAMLAAGFTYRGMGRGMPATATGVSIDEDPTESSAAREGAALS
jgi:hypothetical protein